MQVCVLDPGSGLCVGCGRTGEEIGGWLAMTPQARARIMAALPERLRAWGRVKFAPVDVGRTSALQADATQLMNEVGWR